MNLISMIVFALLIELIITIFPFPKKIWLYWSGGYNNLSFLNKLCFYSIQKEAAKFNWEVISLQPDNLHQYISEMQKFNQIYNHHKCWSEANKADLIRLFLLQQHGGLWLDISTFFVEDLSWLQNIKEQKKSFVTNQVYESQQEPDVLMLYNTLHQHKNYYLTSEGQMINESPGYESYFILAKKNVTLIREWKNKFIQYYQKDYYTILDDLKKNQIYMPNFGSGYYHRVYFALYFILQTTQKQIDRNLNFLQTNRQIRKTSSDVYRIWGIDCALGPCAIFQKYYNYEDSSFESFLARLTLKELQPSIGPIRFFIKFIYMEHVKVQGIFSQQIRFKSDKWSIMDSFVNRPWFTQCQDIIYIVQGSVLGLVARSHPQGQKVKVISYADKISWLDQCLQLHAKRFWFSRNTNQKIRTFFWYLALTIVAWILFDKKKYPKNNKKLQSFEEVQNNQGYDNNKIIQTKYAIMNSQKNESQKLFQQTDIKINTDLNEQRSINKQQTQYFNQIKYPEFQKLKILFNSKIPLILLLLVSIKLFIQYCLFKQSIRISFQRSKGQYKTTTILLILSLTVDYFIQKLTINELKLNINNYKLSVQVVVNFLFKLTQLLTVYQQFSIAQSTIILLVQRNEDFAYYSIVLGLIGPCVITMIRKSPSIQSYIISRMINKIPYYKAITILYLFVCIFPNSIYQVRGGFYVSLSIVSFISQLIFFLLAALLIKNLWKIFTQSKYQNIKQQKSQFYQICFHLLALNLCYVETSINYHRFYGGQFRRPFQQTYCVMYLMIHLAKICQNETKEQISNKIPQKLTQHETNQTVKNQRQSFPIAILDQFNLLFIFSQFCMLAFEHNMFQFQVQLNSNGQQCAFNNSIMSSSYRPIIMIIDYLFYASAAYQVFSNLQINIIGKIFKNGFLSLKRLIFRI